MKVTILGVKIDDVSVDGAVKTVEGWLEKTGKHYIVTPNPEFLMAAQKDLEFKKILNNADLAIPDGVGLKLSGDIENTSSGIDLMEGLVRMASEKGFAVGFLGGRDRVAEETAKCLRKKYPKLKITMAIDGGRWNIENGILKMENGELNNKNIPSNFDLQNTTINPLSSIVKTDILFVAFGHVKQEKWIAENLPKIPVRVAMGVGGAFDYLSGKVTRAPKWLRDLGLEWFFRLIIQPWRIKRQFSLLKYIWLLTNRR